MIRDRLLTTYRSKDLLWLYIWLCGLLLLAVWDIVFLNRPALEKVTAAFFNTFFVSILVIGLSTLMAWSAVLASCLIKSSLFQTFFEFILNLLRSIPQIVGILLGYILLTIALQNEMIANRWLILAHMALVISMFIFLEIYDLFMERIVYYRRLDFVDAMLVCGISEHRIINREILIKCSRAHLLNKLIAVFGTSVFLQCSIDFIISIGLTTKISAVDFPPTLGSMLARIDSKQDILAIGHSLLDWGYAHRLLFDHLQGLTVAFLIVFTLLCLYKISNGFARRYRL